MTKLLDEALDAVRRMPAAEQDTIANVMLGMARIAEPDEIEPEHLAAVIEGMAQAERGEFAEGEADDILGRAFDRPRTS